MTVLAIAEHRRGELRDVSFELATAGRDLADATDGDLHLAVIGGAVEAFVDRLDREGVDVIHTIDEGEEFNHDVYVQAVEALYDEVEPDTLLMPNSVNGLDYAPAVANRLSLPLVTDAIDIEHDGGLAVTREKYGWPPAEGTDDTEVRAFDADIDESAVRSAVTGFQEVGGGDVDISEAEVLVSVGRGIEDEENIALIEALAETLDATLSSSRPIVDNGWLPKNRQVGQSGKQVTPEVYIAIGISGAVQHVAGMKGAETIVAINTDSNAPIYDLADYGIVDDLFEVVPALIEEFGGEPPEV
ncbi:MAG: electron transfer flavoprotein subunit alpha/FixB family protein [Halobacteriales archaeon SW_9_67_24]|nr:MAG: electron transfer flavoprotein subunit alpha/FixB family protein [Halobacteriales archaeon SW_9_67_24]